MRNPIVKRIAVLMKAKLIAIFAVALAVVPMASKAGIMFELDATDSNNRFELLGLNVDNVLTVNFSDFGANSAWNAWGRTSCTDTGGTVGGSGVCAGWITNLSVEFGVGSTDVTTFGSLRYLDAAAALRGSTPIVLTGYESYGFFINDSNYPDNAGGVSVELTVDSAVDSAENSAVPVPVPAPLALLPIGLLGLGLSRRKKA